jgi:GntR family transcriptional repressor for pyruvate dehydrogenase complex
VEAGPLAKEISAVSRRAPSPLTPAAPSPWSPVTGGRASGQVVRQVRDAFFAGMQPGDWVGTEAELAERFGVSRVTMRDAVRTLEAMGILEVKVGGKGGLRVAGSVASRFSEALAVQVHLLGVEWQEIGEAMLTIEPSAARFAAARADEEQLALLDDCVAEHREHRRDKIAFNNSASRFHFLVAEASGNRPLAVALHALRMTQDRLLEPSASGKVATLVIAYHARILDAIKGGDGIEAERLMAEHLGEITGHRPI